MSVVRRMPIAWALAIALTLATLVGILILTRDLSSTNEIFKDGVQQANNIENTTGQAIDGADQLPPADDAINGGVPQVLGIVDSLGNANHTLSSLSDELHELGQVLDTADPSLVSIIESAHEATSEANATTGSATHLNNTLEGANNKVETLGTLLDRTQALSTTIDSKLRIALLLPKIPKG